MSGISEKVVVHMLTFNSVASVAGSLRTLVEQEGILPSDLEIWVTDNASSDGTVEVLTSLRDKYHANSKTALLSFTFNHENSGFCAGHNAAITRFLATDAEYFLVLNPDVALTPRCIHTLRENLRAHHMTGSATPKLMRCDESLTPLSPPQVDAAGMMITSELRHLDRGSGEEDRRQYDRSGFVFGGTGACLMLRRACIEHLLLPATRFDSILKDVFPTTKEGLSSRRQLFDESFFAYREDADLAWRSQRMGWRCRYVADALAYHTRKVLPERRSELPKSLNRHSVRNRFLLQLNHYSPSVAWGAFIDGFIVRNLLVIAGVLLKEWSSLGALRDVIYLAPRALALRKAVNKRAANSVSEWFKRDIL